MILKAASSEQGTDWEGFCSRSSKLLLGPWDTEEPAVLEQLMEEDAV